MASLTAYSDVQPLLDACLQHGGLRYNAGSPEYAAHIRYRCYAYRTALQKEITGPTQYDLVTISHPDKKGILVFTIRPPATGEVTDLQGRPVTLPPRGPKVDDELMAEALKLADEYKDEED